MSTILCECFCFYTAQVSYNLDEFGDQKVPKQTKFLLKLFCYKLLIDNKKNCFYY